MNRKTLDNLIDDLVDAEVQKDIAIFRQTIANEVVRLRGGGELDADILQGTRISQEFPRTLLESLVSETPNASLPIALWVKRRASIEQELLDSAGIFRRILSEKQRKASRKRKP